MKKYIFSMLMLLSVALSNKLAYSQCPVSVEPAIQEVEVGEEEMGTMDEGDEDLGDFDMEEEEEVVD